MKKTLALILALVLCFSLLTACGDPTEADFENYLNVDMVDVNANYSAMTEETNNWNNYTTNEEFITSLQEVILPLIDDSLTKLAAIEPETEKVQALKAQYVSAMESYKEGFSLYLEAFRTNDETKSAAGDEKINTGVETINEYNKGLEALAAEFGATIEY